MTDITHLNALIEDSERALRSGDTGPADPTNYSDLMGRLVTARDTLPPAYRTAVWEPFVGVLQQVGERGFVQILLQDPEKQGLAGLVLDAAHAILQNGERYEQNATDGFQEVVADLYDGFLSAEDRRGVKQPDRGTLAPLVKWGQPDFGPYTFPISATENLGMGAAIVNMPPANARSGMLAWAALPHEVAGHDLMHADTGLHAELQNVVRNALSAFNGDIANYWADRIDETASDVMGIMNMGPAAAIGLIGYFRSIQSVQGRGRRLSSVGFARDVHPAGVLRGYLAAGALMQCEAPEAHDWAATIEAEVDNDARSQIVIVAVRSGNPPSFETRFTLTRQEARDSAKAVAAAVAKKPLESLERSSIAAIQNWRHEDEIITQYLANLLGSNQALSASLATGVYAAHVVAAAILSTLRGAASPAAMFPQMTALLERMHRRNPTWSSLSIRNFGNVTPIRLSGVSPWPWPSPWPVLGSFPGGTSGPSAVSSWPIPGLNDFEAKFFAEGPDDKAKS